MGDTFGSVSGFIGPMNNKILFVADDYGMCESVNSAIEDCLKVGVLRNTCVMVNMPGFQDAVYLKKKFPSVSVGIHWNLTQGKPISPFEKVSSLVKNNGEFIGGKEFRTRLKNGLVKYDQVELELNAQTKVYRDMIGEPSFWNTHENFHVWPVFFNHVVSIAGKLRIHKMRCHNRIVVTRDEGLSIGRLTFWIKGIFISYLSYQTKKLGFKMPNGLIYPFGYINYKADVEAILRTYKLQQNSTAEYVIHPATSVESSLFGTLGESRIKEYLAFRNLSLPVYVSQFGLVSVSFDELE